MNEIEKFKKVIDKSFGSFIVNSDWVEEWDEELYYRLDEKIGNGWVEEEFCDVSYEDFKEGNWFISYEFKEYPYGSYPTIEVLITIAEGHNALQYYEDIIRLYIDEKNFDEFPIENYTAILER